MMPTSSRLAAAICLALLAWVVSGMVMATMPERQQWGNFQPFNALVGFAVGWFVVGRRLRVDYITAMGIGFTGMVATVFWVLFAHGVNGMLDMSLDRRFDGPVEAILAVFKLGIEYGYQLADINIILTLLIGGMLSGVVSEFVERRWS